MIREGFREWAWPTRPVTGEPVICGPGRQVTKASPEWIRIRRLVRPNGLPRSRIAPPLTITAASACSPWSGAPLSDIAECVAAATGVAFTYDDFVKAGERTWNLERLWNLRAGFTDKDDTLPERLLKQPHPSGPSKGVVVHLEQMLPVYYRVRGWDEHGVPKPEKLAELGLASV
jgi:hypothetical protein